MYLKSHDICLYYEKYGTASKNTIVILPGWGNTRTTFYEMIEFLKDKFLVYILDYPGFGLTKFPNRDLTIYDYALLIKDFLEQEEITNPILLGHSFGGRIAILLSGYYHYPCQKIILIDSAGIIPKRSFNRTWKTLEYKTLKKLSTLLSSKKRKKMEEWLIQKYGSNDYKELPSYMRKTFSNIVRENLAPYLKEVTPPTLLLWGENDKTTPLSDGRQMEKELVDGGLVVIKNASHFPYLEKPYVINIIIENFLQEKKEF